MAWSGVRRLGPGRPRLWPASMIADRGYSGRPVRGELRRRAIRAVIPQKRSEPPAYLMDWTAYRRRHVVERLVNRLKQYRRIATRYEKRADTYQAFVILAAIRLWLGSRTSLD
jgi:transposase